MKTSNTYHIPALLNETVDLLNVKPGKRFIDATLGGGGHSEEIVRKKGMLLGIDQDPEAVSFASERLKTFACPGLVPPKIVQSNFSRIDEVAKDVGFEKVDGILFDLGVSSHQLETAQRGFSFNQGPLDMRMDKTFSVTAKDLVNGLNEGELADLFLKLGEERLSQRYAKAICKERLIKPIVTCNELSEIIVKEALPRGRPALTRRGRFDRTHPATRVFQALRIAVNDELNSLKEALPKAVELLNKKGRLVLLSFHSLEDGIVKRFFLDQEEKGILKIITKKPITPSAEEVNLNPRARSAKLRAAEKIC